MIDPATAERATAEPVTAEPAAPDPEVEQPGSEQPGAEDPGIEQPGGRRGRGRPRSRRADDAILAATLTLLEHRGMAALSIEAVAQQAGVAKTTIYRRWPHKHDLIVDALAGARGPIVRPPPGQTLRDDLVDILRGVWDGHRDPAGGRLMLRVVSEADDFPGLAQAYVERIVAPRRDSLLALLRRSVAEQTLRPDIDLDLMAEALVAPVLLGAWTGFPPHLDRDRIAGLVDLVLAGCAPPLPGCAHPTE